MATGWRYALICGGVLLHSWLQIQHAQAQPQTWSQQVWLTENYPPFVYRQDARMQGIALELLQALADELKQPSPRLEMVTHTEMMQRMSAEQPVAGMPVVRLPAREERFQWLGPIAPVRFVLLGLQAASPPTEQRWWRVGALDEDVYRHLMANSVHPAELMLAASPFTLLRHLQQGRLDFCLLEEHRARLLLQQAGLESSDFYSYQSFASQELWFALNKATPAEEVERWQHALERVKARPHPLYGTFYQSLLVRY